MTRERRFLVALLAATILLRLALLAAVLATDPSRVTSPDTPTYVDSALALARDGAFLTALLGLAARLVRAKHDLTDEQLGALLTIEDEVPPWPAQAVKWAMGLGTALEYTYEPEPEPVRKPWWRVW